MKYILWSLPLLGLGLGYLYAFVFLHGLLETWHFIGKPDENIGRILGMRDGRELLVATETGKIYSFGFLDGEEATLSPKPAWEEEELDTVNPVHRLEYYGADFYTLPPRFPVRQLVETAHIYNFEGKGEVKFALAADGNLWLWKHYIADLTGLVFQFFPAMGFLSGLAVVVIFAGLRWLRGRSRLPPQQGIH